MQEALLQVLSATPSRRRVVPIAAAAVLLLNGVSVAEAVGGGGGVACRLCKEDIDTSTKPWTYSHFFDTSGEVARECESVENFGGGHAHCHNDPAEGTSCSSHDDCSGGGGSLVALAQQIEGFIAPLGGSANIETHAALLAQQIVASPGVIFVAARGAVELTDCDGFTVAEWRLPASAQWRLNRAVAEWL